MKPSRETHAALVLLLLAASLAVNAGAVITSSPEGLLLWEKTGLGANSVDRITTIEWSPTGEALAVGTTYGVLYLFSPNGDLIWEKRLGEWVSSISWSPEGRLLAVSTGKGSLYVLAENGSTVWKVSDERRGFGEARWSPDGKLVAVASFSREEGSRVEVFSVDGEPLWISPPLGEGILRLDWSPDGSKLAVVDSFEGLYVFSGRGGELLWKALDIGEVVYSPAWSPDGKLLAVGAYHEESDGKEYNLVYVYTSEGGLAWRDRVALGSPVIARWSPDGGMLVVSTTSLKAYTREGKPLWESPSLGSSVYELEWSPRGRVIAALTSMESSVYIFNSEGVQVLRLGSYGSLIYPYYDLEWSPDGRLVAVAAEKSLYVMQGYFGILTISGEPGSVAAIRGPGGEAVVKIDSAREPVTLYLDPGVYRIQYKLPEPEDYIGTGEALRGEAEVRVEPGGAASLALPRVDSLLALLTVKAPPGAFVKVESGGVSAEFDVGEDGSVSFWVDPGAYIVRVSYEGVELEEKVEVSGSGEYLVEFPEEEFLAKKDEEAARQEASQQQQEAAQQAPPTATAEQPEDVTANDSGEAAGTTVTAAGEAQAPALQAPQEENTNPSLEENGGKDVGGMSVLLSNRNIAVAAVALGVVALVAVVASRALKRQPRAPEEPVAIPVAARAQAPRAVETEEAVRREEKQDEAEREAAREPSLRDVEDLLARPIKALKKKLAACTSDEHLATLPKGLAPEGYEGEWRCCKLGCGGWGCAYRCQRPHGGEPVVFKVPRGLEDIVERGASPTLDPMLVEKVRREAEAVARLRHPHLLRLLAYSSAAPILVYEYADGGSLEAQLAEGWRPAVGEALLVGLQLGDALRYIHTRGMVHGDVKPGNVFVRSGVVKLGDFSSLVRLVTMTSRHQLAYTPGWRAPEQVYLDLRRRAVERGLENRIDVYQLGNLTLYLLTGEALDGEEAADEARLEEALAKVSDSELREVLREMLAAEPWRRPSMEEAVKRLYIIYKRLSPESEN